MPSQITTEQPRFLSWFSKNEKKCLSNFSNFSTRLFIKTSAFCFSIALLLSFLIPTQHRTEEIFPLFYPVRVNGKWGFIDTTGSMRILPQFSAPHLPFRVRGIVNLDNTSRIVINERGETIFPLPKVSMPINFNGEWFNIDEPSRDSIYFFDLNGHKKLSILRKGISDVAGNFDACNRLRLILSGKKCVYINKKGEHVFTIKKGSAGPFDSESKLARVIFSSKTCYYDTSGRIKFCVSGEGSSFSDGVALIEHKQKKYFIDEAGKTKLDVSQYDQVFPYHNDLALVIKGDHQGYIDIMGKLCIPIQYEEISRFTLGVAAAKDSKDGKWILIDAHNEMLSTQRFDWLDRHGFSGYLCRANKNDTTGWINRKGHFVWIDPH